MKDLYLCLFLSHVGDFNSDHVAVVAAPPCQLTILAASVSI